MSVETWNTGYPTFVNGKFEKLFLRQIVPKRYEGEVRQKVWSVRLSTGLLGKPDCKSGNSSHAPKGENDLMLLVGDEGLKTAIDLGFIPCPTCRPDDEPGFWEITEKTIRKNYPDLRENIRQFADKNIIGFDSRRVKWEVIAPYLTNLPNRLYVPEGLNSHDIQEIKTRFEKIGFNLPPVGYYIREAPWFREYKI